MSARLGRRYRFCAVVATCAAVVTFLCGCIATPSGNDTAAAGARDGVRVAVSTVADDGSLPADATGWLHAFHQNGGAGNGPRLIDGTSTGYAWAFPQEPVVFRADTDGRTAVLDVISAGVGYGQVENVQIFAYVCAKLMVDPGRQLKARASDLTCPKDVVAAAGLQTATAVTLGGTPSATWTPQPPASPPGG